MDGSITLGRAARNDAVTASVEARPPSVFDALARGSRSVIPITQPLDVLLTLVLLRMVASPHFETHEGNPFLAGYLAHPWGFALMAVVKTSVALRL